VWTWPFRICDGIRQRARERRWHPEHALGRKAEDLAHRFLQGKGLVVVERNWRHPGRRGEVDLVAWEGAKLVFVEVKARRDEEFGAPERAIDALKINNVRRAARYFAKRWRVPEELVRFDLVTVVFAPMEIRHYPEAWAWRDEDPVSSRG
jgi:putative endonuclease